ncbi:MAG: hypothetical protein ABSA58_22180 [Acetobacteraceae bacterium]|jgi:hypothetical protein
MADRRAPGRRTMVSGLALITAGALILALCAALQVSNVLGSNDGAFPKLPRSLSALAGLRT